MGNHRLWVITSMGQNRFDYMLLEAYSIKCIMNLCLIKAGRDQQNLGGLQAFLTFYHHHLYVCIYLLPFPHLFSVIKMGKHSPLFSFCSQSTSQVPSPSP
jgi:hypothetical protein